MPHKPSLTARYRCVFCRHVTEGEARRAPPCGACGRLAVRILGRAKVVKVDRWDEEEAT